MDHVPLKKCIATVQFTYRDKRRRDTSNDFAALKSAVDGLVDAKIMLDDQHITWHVPPAIVDRLCPGVTITIEEEAQ